MSGRAGGSAASTLPSAAANASTTAIAALNTCFIRAGLGIATRVSSVQEPDAATVQVVHGADERHVALRGAGLALR